jgi:hypothetical protein
MSYVWHIRHSTRTTSCVVHVRHRISMSYIGHILVRHRNIRCRTSTCILYRMSNIRYRMSNIRYCMSHRIQHRMIDLHIVRSCIQHRTRHCIRHRMRCSFNWIWSWVQGVQFACTITQAQEFAWQCIHSGIDSCPTSSRLSRAIAAALGRGGRGSRFLLPLFIIPIRHAVVCGVNGILEYSLAVSMCLNIFADLFQAQHTDLCSRLCSENTSNPPPPRPYPKRQCGSVQGHSCAQTTSVTPCQPIQAKNVSGEAHAGHNHPRFQGVCAAIARATPLLQPLG